MDVCLWLVSLQQFNGRCNGCFTREVDVLDVGQFQLECR